MKLSISLIHHERFRVIDKSSKFRLHVLIFLQLNCPSTSVSFALPFMAVRQILPNHSMVLLIKYFVVIIICFFILCFIVSHLVENVGRSTEFLKMKPVKKRGSVPEWWVLCESDRCYIFLCYYFDAVSYEIHFDENQVSCLNLGVGTYEKWYRYSWLASWFWIYNTRLMIKKKMILNL